MGMFVEKVIDPIVDTVRYFKLGELGHQWRMSNCIERFREIKWKDVHEIILVKHCGDSV